MQEHLYKHFYSDGHNGFLEDVAITLINKTDHRDPKKQGKLLNENFQNVSTR